MDRGWVKFYRKLTYSKLWLSEPFTRGQAWVDLVSLANHDDNFFYLRDHKITVKRGQIGWSQIKLSTRWKWSRTKTRKFLNDLEIEQQLIQQVSHSTSIITLCNYEKYQEKEQLGIQQKDNRKTTERQQKNTNKNDKNYNNDENKEKIYKKEKVIKKKYGEYKHVFLTDEQYQKLEVKFNGKLNHWIQTLDEGIEMKPGKYSYNNHYLALLKWAGREDKEDVGHSLPPELRGV